MDQNNDSDQKIYDSKLYFHNKRSDMHYLRISAKLARDKKYPLRGDSKIICAANGKTITFCKEEDKDLLKEIIRGNSTPTFKQLIEEEKTDDVYGEI